MLVKIGENTFFAKKPAADLLAWRQGLSGIESLDNNDCFLMLFPKTQSVPISMYEMKMPIDILWISAQKKIIGIAMNIFPSGNNTLIPQIKGFKAKYLIEVKAGSVGQNKIRIGDRIKLMTK